MIKKATLIIRTITVFILGILFTFMNYSFASAAPNNATINFYNQNGIYYYDATGNQANYGCGTIVANCDIRGDTHDERLWSGIRNYGFTPEQTAALMGNFAHEGGTPVRQEDAYNIARDNGVLTQQGNPYTIWTDSSETHSIGMQNIYSRYPAGSPIAGIGLGNAQWTSKTRRENYLHTMEASGLLKYFEGDAYKVYGRLSDDSLKAKIIEETGSEDEYWALWCAMLNFMSEELHNDYSEFFNKTTVDDMANYVAARYEVCSGCASGGSSNTARRQTAQEIYTRYQNGEFNAIENGTASSASTNASSGNNPSSTSSTETGSNVLIIGDSITNRSSSAIKTLLPDVTINAQDGRTFQEGLDILESMPQGNIPDILVFALGSNGGATETRAKRVIEIAGNNRQVIFVTDYSLGWHDYTQTNALFNSLKDQYNNVIVAEWAAAVSSHPDPDKYIAKETYPVDVHPTIPDGTELFAKVLYEAITNGTLQATNNAICAGEYWNGEGLPEYLQCDDKWGNLAFGLGGINGSQGSTICAAGCGPTSFAIMATVLLGREISPSETADIAGRAGIYVPGRGSSWTITKTLADHYGLQYQDFGTSQSTCIDTINKALSDGWMIHTSGGGVAPFTGGGHYIGIAGIASNGDWIIADSNLGNKNYSPSTVLSAGMNCSNLKGIKK